MARTVLRGRDGGNVVLPPDYLRDYAWVPELEVGLERYFRTPTEVHFG
jgi:hypothetical protein